ncbi:S9 family peptidase [Moheibacter lacus]|uniref:S9 family peptidase n=1 Tax=Moheibacter lacus TaxID=2745851 RepID=A0A838ZTL2_9FLAO|nr:prolyl oligopeptidase family serine peptidase [Moheibacter lacus]MBA5630328.1 S9 family peptidase [Moheibacter lacus]
MRNKFFIIKLLILILGVQIGAQDNSKKLETYHSKFDSLWSKNIYVQSNSENGKWMVFSEVYDLKPPKITLLNVQDLTNWDISDSYMHAFSSNSQYFASLSQDSTLLIQNLNNHHQVRLEKVIKFHFDKKDHIIALSKRGNQNSLLLFDGTTNQTNEIENVKDYFINPQKDTWVTLSQSENQEELTRYSIHERENNSVFISNSENIAGCVWNDSGNAMGCFLKQKESNSILLCQNNQTRILTDAEINRHFKDFSISDKKLEISEDGKKVFFFRSLKTNPDKKTKEKDMEVWDTSDPWIFPQMNEFNSYERKFFLTLWQTETKNVSPITDSIFSSYQLNKNHEIALVYNKLDYEPQYKYFPESDIYLLHLSSGKKEKIIEKQSVHPGLISISPSGNFIAYFSDHHWWLYDVRKKKKKNLTSELPFPFSQEEFDLPFGSPGWIEDEKYLIVYDQYDIWLLDTGNNTHKKRTNGRSSKMKYRINRDVDRHDSKYLSLLSESTGVSYNPKSRKIILDRTGHDLKTGISIWDKNEIVDLVYGSALTEDLTLSSNQSLLIYKKSKFNLPPSLHSIDLSNHKTKELYQSNPGLLQFDLGKHVFYHYKESDNNELEGLIFFPSNYNPQKKYPMIVKIYEAVNTFDMRYMSPTIYEGTGFNLVNYLTNGYFVLMPTIKYEKGNPAKSSLLYVENAVKKALKTYPVDPKKVGLIGHSYGGYQATYIATKSDMFATAVAGAPVTDLGIYYLDISWDFKREQIWRIENKQFRMGKSYFEAKKQYNENSALQSIEELKTPLLLWAGKEDGNVNWTQSVHLFMAMKRLNKEGKLLLFNNEPHSVDKLENQKDLSEEVMSWFNHYLK